MDRRSQVQVPLGSAAGFVSDRTWFNSPVTLAHGQKVCFLPLGILNLLSLFQWFVSLALKSASGGERSKYKLHYTSITTIMIIAISLLHPLCSADFDKMYPERLRRTCARGSVVSDFQVIRLRNRLGIFVFISCQMSPLFTSSFSSTRDYVTQRILQNSVHFFGPKSQFTVISSHFS